MKDIQEVFDELLAIKKEQKIIRKEYREMLNASEDYEAISEKLKESRDKKKQIELTAQSQMGARYEQLEDLSEKIKELEQTVSDIAMSTLMEGKTVQVTDPDNNAYEPTYKVSFKKTA